MGHCRGINWIKYGMKYLFVQVVFLVKGPIYLVCISCTEEPFESLKGQLELIYGQVALTASLQISTSGLIILSPLPIQGLQISLDRSKRSRIKSEPEPWDQVKMPPVKGSSKRLQSVRASIKLFIWPRYRLAPPTSSELEIISLKSPKTSQERFKRRLK